MRYFILLLSLVAMSCDNSQVKEVANDGEIKSYEPSEPISFEHSSHGHIDCRLCHNSVDGNKKAAGIPTVDICIKCHVLEKGKVKSTLKEAQQKESFDSKNDSLLIPEHYDFQSEVEIYYENYIDRAYNEKQFETYFSKDRGVLDSLINKFENN